ncbi:hypothetical protein V8E55_010539 [Tylopilus felleus]
MSVDVTFNAFRIPYVAGFPQALLKTVDEYHKDRRYNHSIYIVQSSGTGKSRGVAEAANIRFTFLFNLRRDLQFTRILHQTSMSGTTFCP